VKSFGVRNTLSRHFIGSSEEIAPRSVNQNRWEAIPALWSFWQSFVTQPFEAALQITLVTL